MVHQSEAAELTPDSLLLFFLQGPLFWAAGKTERDRRLLSIPRAFLQHLGILARIFTSLMDLVQLLGSWGSTMSVKAHTRLSNRSLPSSITFHHIY